MSFQASCPACGSPVHFDVPGSVVTICPSCQSAVGRADGKLESLGKVADLVQTDSPFQCGLRGKFKGVPFEITGRSQIRHSAGGVWDEWYVAFRGGKRWGWLAEAQGRYYLTFEHELPPDHEIPPLAELDIEDTIAIPKMGQMKIIEIGEGTIVSGEGEIPWALRPGEAVEFADLSGGGRKFGTLDENGGKLTFYAGGEVTLQDMGLESAASREREARIVAAAQVNCPNCGGPLELQAPDQTLRVACPYCASMLSCDHGNLKFLQALAKKKIEPILPLGSKGVFDPEVAGTDWEEPQELTVIGFMQRKVTYEGIDYSWHEYLLYKPRLPFYWLIYNEGHWSFGQSVPAGDVKAGPTQAYYSGASFKIYDRGEPVVDYVLGEFYWEVNVGEQVKSADYIHPPDMLSRETNQNPAASPMKDANAKRDKKNREINYTVSRYVPVEEIENAFGRDDLREPYSIAPNQPYPHKDIYKMWGLMCAAALFLILVVYATSSRRLVYGNNKTYSFQPAASKEVVTEPFKLEGGDNICVNVNCFQWVYLDGEFINEKGEVPSNGKFGVSSGKKVYLEALPGGTYKMRFNATWKTMTSPSPSFTVEVRQDVPHFSQVFWLGLGIMLLPVGVMIHHVTFSARRWQDSDYSPFNTE